jgi:hypothetical protein
MNGSITRSFASYFFRLSTTRSNRLIVRIGETRRTASDFDEGTSRTKLNRRETGWMDGWMDTLDLNLSRTMHERMLAAAPLLNASSFRRMHTIACWPSPCFLCGCYADARHGSELFPDELRIRASPRRSPKSKSHAHPARGKFHHLRIYRQGRRWFRSSFLCFSKSGATFSSPAKLITGKHMQALWGSTTAPAGSIIRWNEGHPHHAVFY